MAESPAGGGGTGNIRNQDSSKSGHGGRAGLEHAPAGAGLAGLLTAAAGPGERYASLDDAGLTGAVRRWADEEAWCHGRMLAAIRPRPDSTAVTFTPAGPPPPGGYGDQDGYGTWNLRIADLDLTLAIDPIPGGACDHRYETSAYRPSPRLRRLVQVRDGECVMPACSRHPKGPTSSTRSPGRTD